MKEKDLGVTVTNNLKWNKQCTIAASKANKILGHILNSFDYLDCRSMKLLYTALVRPHLEYVGVLHLKLTFPFLKGYKEEQLNSLNQSKRRLRGDLIPMYKIINGVEKIKFIYGVNFAKILSGNIRKPNNLRLVREINKRSSGRFNFLTNRIVSTWNNLSSACVSALSVNNFKACID
ncbi:unnamed protein product [Brachionus calyciflorus]|uniref:RNA-directed DNA polymerase from mobile element jockey-like n=1 Tax=Brachionus calyciflorus TaxID=104777 RepID=A0A814HYY4_9BILA|nr:unnamed protein product [Brachionus calyciflorus]